MDRWNKRYVMFKRKRWGPAVMDVIDFSTHVQMGDSARVTATYNGVRSTGVIGAAAFLVPGAPILLDGEQIAIARHLGKEGRGLIKPGTIRFEGDHPLITPGLRLRGHLLPPRLTLRDDVGKLVWSPPIIGLLNSKMWPAFLVAPWVSERAEPEHIALWLACWLQFEDGY